MVAAFSVIGRVSGSAHGQNHASMNGVDFDSDIMKGRSHSTDYRAWNIEIS